MGPQGSLFRAAFLGLVAAVVTSCSGSVATAPVYVGGDAPMQAPGVAQCTSDQPDAIRIDPGRPVVVLVHGCFSSGSKFKRLADVFELHGQQVLCFNYDDRDSLRAVALQLQRFLYDLDSRLDDQTITVVGHSQGGMISRISLSDWEPAPEQADFRLVTVSSPLSGIEAAEHCGWTGLHIATLGITVAVCTAIVGSPWTEIHPGSRIWAEPLPLNDAVREHLTIITDEKGTCRDRAESGECDEDDFVFTTAEQRNEHLIGDTRVRTVVVKAGHAEIVGERGIEPQQLVETLQNHKVLLPTPANRRAELARLLTSWF